MYKKNKLFYDYAHKTFSFFRVQTYIILVDKIVSLVTILKIFV